MTAETPATGPASSALEGVRVLDLTHQVAGPSATLALAYMGADVVKIVTPGSRDSYDALPFYLNNASKRSIALDLKSEEGRARLYELAEVADVCIENFGPGVAERLGVTYEKLKERNPAIIFAQIKGFAEETKFRDYPAFDPIAQAYSGASSITGAADGVPMRPGPDLGDTGTGMVVTSGILAALYQRTRTGEGQHIRIAMADQIATFMRIHYAWPIGMGRATPRFGNNAPFTRPTGPSDVYPCAPFGPNDYVHIHCGNDRQWARMAEAIGRPELATDERFATEDARAENSEALDAIIIEWCSTKSKYEAMETLGSAGVPAGAVRDTMDIIQDEDLRERGIIVPVPHETLGEVPLVGWPIRMSGSRNVVKAPPRPGEHTEEVFEEWLGATRAAARG